MGRPASQDPIRQVKAKLANGTYATYFYDRATGAALGTNLEVARARSLALRAETTKAAKEGTLGAVITAYLKSPAYRREIRPSTQEMYRRTIDQLREKFDDFPVSGITPAMVQELKESLQETPTKANHTLAILSVLLNYARQKGLVVANAAARAGKITTPPRTQVWTVEEEDRVLAALRPRLKLAFMMLLYTLQRPSDVLSMTLNQIRDRDGRLWIALRQQKTLELVEIPVHDRLAPLIWERLGDTTTSSLLIVPSPKGQQWRRRNFARAWDIDLEKANAAFRTEMAAQGWPEEKIEDELKVRHRQRRDLRRTGVVRMAEAGATVAQIAAVAGWSIDYAQRIVDTYLPRRSEVALGAMEAWEKLPNQVGSGQRVVRLSDHR